MIANPSDSARVPFPVPFVKVPRDICDRLEGKGDVKAAVPIYMALAAYKNHTTLLAYPLVHTASERTEKSVRTWKRGTAALKAGRLIRKGKYPTRVRGTIAYQVKPINQVLVPALESENETMLVDVPWAAMNPDLAWESFSVNAWRLLIEIAYRNHRKQNLKKWATEAGVPLSSAHRAMKDLEAAGWVEKVGGGKRDVIYTAATHLNSGARHLTTVSTQDPPILTSDPTNSRKWPTDQDLPIKTMLVDGELVVAVSDLRRILTAERLGAR